MSGVIEIPEGAQGFDCNTPLTDAVALAARKAGYSFVVRYVPRIAQKPIDLTAAETVRMLRAGLAVMAVQHVEMPGWLPDIGKGIAYGKSAAESAFKAGIALGCCVWLDLEGVAPHTPVRTVIDYCNSWYREVAKVGYTPGIYVGYDPGIGADDLYHRLRFEHYWAAYNLNDDQVPSVRGVQMQQHTQKIVAGIEVDPDTVMRDQKGGLPLAHMPDEWEP